jgi:hypothetical protein
MMRAFLVRAGEEQVIIQPTLNEVTGTVNKAIVYYNGTGKGVHIAIGINDEELLIAHVTADGAMEIDAMEEPEPERSDFID